MPNLMAATQAILRGIESTMTSKTMKRIAKKVQAKAAAVESNRIREDGSISIRESWSPKRLSGRILEAVPGAGEGEKVYKVVLITEGLGNRRNMNYYGPEAIKSAVTAFEGKWCFLNHDSVLGEKNLPERDVMEKAGYFKNLKEAEIDGTPACVGELHCDLSESGKKLADKIDSALHYKKEFPDNGLEYCGFSVNGDGSAEPRNMLVEGEREDVNYVLEFTEGDSCDLVTTPARGGRGLGVIKEDASGSTAVSIISTEEGMITLKNLKAIFAALKESAKKATGDTKKGLDKQVKALESEIKALEDAGMESATEESDVEAMCAQREGESDEDHKARLHKLAKGIAKHLGSAVEAEPNPDDEPDTDDEPASEAKPSQESRRAAESRRQPKLSGEELRRNKIAVKAVITESELPEDFYSDEEIAAMAAGSFAEAERKVKADARRFDTILRHAEHPVASLGRAARESVGDKTQTFKQSMKEAR